MANFVLDKGFLWQGSGVVSAFYFVGIGSADWTATALTTTTGQRAVGVVQENLDAAKAATGKAIVDVRMLGITRVVVGAGGCTRNTAGMADATGAAITATGSGKVPLGIFLQTGVAGDQIDFLLCPGMTALP